MATKRPTLLVFLHGVGDSAAGVEDVARAIVQGLPDVEVVVPDGFHPFDGGFGGRQWFSLTGVTEENRPARVRAAADEVSRYADAELGHRGWPRERVVFAGFSQGAMVAAWLAVHRKPAPVAGVVLSGRYSDDSSPARLVSTPIFVAHGAQDPRIPVAVVEPSVRALEAWGARVSSRVYPDLGHQISGREVQDARAFLADVLRA
ncbi:MAG TPA: dienelactone hydrolase family protein [Polyangia bacterium]|nr:dienelactone hydrolase family protein [Polyangia bacterium]